MPPNLLRGLTKQDIMELLILIIYKLLETKQFLNVVLLRSYHFELNRRTLDRDVDLRIRYIDGIPKILLERSKNGSYLSRPPTKKS